MSEIFYPQLLRYQDKECGPPLAGFFQTRNLFQTGSPLPVFLGGSSTRPAPRRAPLPEAPPPCRAPFAAVGGLRGLVAPLARVLWLCPCCALGGRGGGSLVGGLCAPPYGRSWSRPSVGRSPCAPRLCAPRLRHSARACALVGGLIARHPSRVVRSAPPYALRQDDLPLHKSL
jgi:hypothetical protein